MNLKQFTCPDGQFPCQFCDHKDLIQMYRSECPNCNVHYMSVNNSINDYEKHIWTLVMITYDLNDPIYCSIVMDLRKEETTIWFNPRGPNMKKIVLPQIFPDTLPKDAPALAKKLHHLIAFS